MTHVFDVDVAVEYGVDQAIVIANFQYWITHNAANRKNLFRGKYWTYNSHKALTQIFPYYSEKQIRRILSDLLDKQVLEADTFNQHDYDKTKWYSFINEQRWVKIPFKGGAQTGTGCPEVPVIPSAQMGEVVPKRAEGGAQMGNPIPLSILTDNKPNTKQENIREDEAGKSASAANGSPVDALPVQPPVAEAPQKKSKAKKEKAPALPLSAETGPKPKGKETLYQLMMKTYFDWMEDVLGVTPMIDGAQGKALKSLQSYFLGVTCKRADHERNNNPNAEITAEMIEVATNASWGKLLQGMTSEHVDPFLRGKTKLTEISSNLQNIINQLKNGNPKQQKGVRKEAGTEDVRESFAQRFAGK